ncbi:Pkinase domain-containing protein/Usp domain-containing protein [Cephalotus follicularis]|uniref:RING-type E3 ubiquitin transferase n=1 Tax=Cephalotus follicularis TaxID=3775 RepID=A0A1Q3CFF2_CEPFO|nr:Pkinase domain-containing protein/Usp domain-containing protein [Cephalotus follicularis]
MWLPRGNGTKKGIGNGLVAVAIDRDKGSQHALKWAAENLLSRGRTVILIHVVQKQPSGPYCYGQVCDFNASPHRHSEKQTKDLFLTFHCYCTRKDIQCLDVVLEDMDIVKALTEYASYAAIENLVLGASSRHGFIKKFKADHPSGVSKGAPDFCNVYVISKGKISSARKASRPAPYNSPLLDHIQSLNNNNDNLSDTSSKHSISFRDKVPVKPRSSIDEFSKSPLLRGRGQKGNSFADFSDTSTDISFVSSSRPSTDRTSSVLQDYIELSRTSRPSTSSDHSLGSIRLGPRFTDQNLHDFSYVSQESGRTSCSYSSQNLDEVETEMRRLKQELKQTMDLYSTACREAITAKQKATELQRWRLDEERRIGEARLAEECALSVAEKEKTKHKAAMETAEASKRMAELEARRRMITEMNALKEAEDVKTVLDSLAQKDIRYRRYTIEEIEEATEHFAQSRKIGEGGYGPVYRCHLDHTPVAVKVLRPDAAQGRSQFQQEIEVLSCIRHPHMVLLLGACPEYGILVYEYMANGSLDDRLFRRGNTPVLPWQLRFRIAAEIATGLLFLHQTKPEPLVHRDLKPGNILLDHNYVSKVGDVGLARLVPAIAENVTQCRMTSTAGTFCYIDPEYQQTGMLGVKSDLYSLGILLLQVITAKPPMGLTHYVETSIEKGTFKETLDPAVPDWPVEEALSFAKLALKCAELRRKDRPDLGKVVLPELNKLREYAEENMNHMFLVGSARPSPNHSHVSVTQQEVMSAPESVTSTSSQTEKQSDPSQEG